MNNSIPSCIRIQAEVEEALREGRPVVALESCVLSLGLPRPMNLDTAHEYMDVIRKCGAVPAVIALADGYGLIGVSEEELRSICRGEGYLKASCNDLPAVIAKKQRAAATVSASIALAQRVGIKVFSTGGLGGVSPHALEHFDVSSDLLQMARTKMAVVCSGIKSILDATTTIECLETLGIPVALFRTDRFPRFFSTGVHLDVGSRLDEVDELAEFYLNSLDLLDRGVLIANPAPYSKQLPQNEMQPILEEALDKAKREGHWGKKLTPFLMDYMARSTHGATLEVNRALLVSNAELAAQLAVALAEKEKK